MGLPPAWVNVSEEIATNVQRARTKMAELSRAHAKALMPSFGDGKEDQHAIESLTQEITNLLKRSEKRLQKIKSRLLPYPRMEYSIGKAASPFLMMKT